MYVHVFHFHTHSLFILFMYLCRAVPLCVFLVFCLMWSDLSTQLLLFLCGSGNNQLMYIILLMCSKLRPSMMQHLLRRLVFDVPLLNEHTKMPLKVRSNVPFYLRPINSKELFKWIYWDYTLALIVMRIVIVHYNLQCTRFTVVQPQLTKFTKSKDSPLQHEIVIICHRNIGEVHLCIIEVTFYNTLRTYI